MTTTELPHALDAERRDIPSKAGVLSCYVAGEGRPLLLIHSVNAAGSAFEMKPLFDRFRSDRRVYAMELPGFGFSERSERDYSIDLFTAAVKTMIELASDECQSPVDAVALSLSSEFLARAVAGENGIDSKMIGKLALITPTGFRRGDERRTGPQGASREIGWLSGLLSLGPVGRGAFHLLARPGTIRYFLKRTWGSDDFDEALANYDALTVQQPGAQHAPLAFISGRLFSRDIHTLYRALEMPVLLLHGTRGDFKDFRGAEWTEDDPLWTRSAYDAGALVHFEYPDAVHQEIREFFDTRADG